MIVEAMKTMNLLPSTADGMKVKICIEDGQPLNLDKQPYVEYV